MPEKIIGAIQESIEGPGTITHEGGDPILVAEVNGGLPGVEKAIVFEGGEIKVDGEDEFQAAPPDVRSYNFDNTVLIRATGQANYTFEQRAVTRPAEGVEASAAAAKLADELGVELSIIPAKGKITVTDVKAFAKNAL